MERRDLEPSVSPRGSRRPLTEFIKPPAPGAVVEWPHKQPHVPIPRAKASTRPTSSRAAPSRAAPSQHSKEPAPPKPQVSAPSSARSLKPENACGDVKQDPSRNWFGPATAIHAIAAKAIADHRYWLTEHLKGAVSGLFGYASGLVSAGLSAGDQNRERNAAAQQGTGHQDLMQDTAASAATATAQMFRAMSDHWLSNLDYARRLAEVTSAAELILLSTRQAREQVDLLLEQVAAFQALTRSIISGVDRDRPQRPD
jgi:hypothetical protein